MLYSIYSMLDVMSIGEVDRSPAREPSIDMVAE